MPAPTGGGNYASFSETTSGYGVVGYVATDAAGNQGAYVQDSLGYAALVARAGDSPEPGKAFGALTGLSVMGSGFAGYEGVAYGAVRSDLGVHWFEQAMWNDPPAVPTFAPLYDFADTPEGASGAFTGFGPPQFKSRRDSNVWGRQLTFIAFRATTADGVEGIYGGGGVFPHPPAPPPFAASPLVSTADDSFRDFTSISDPSVSSGEIAFAAVYNTPQGPRHGLFSYGQYFYKDGQPPFNYPPPALRQLLAEGDEAPGTGGGRFASFDVVTVQESYQGVFLATLVDGRRALYTFDEAFPDVLPLTLWRVLTTGETFDGRTVAGIDLSREAAGGFVSGSGYRTPFRVDFADGMQGLYYFDAHIPEPATALLPAACALLPRPRRRNP